MPTSTGLPKSKEKRQHFDIYAIFEGPQELYFGDEVQVNINLVEQVVLEDASGEKLKKCYISPTKRRGVERRSLIWAPKASGELLGDSLQCGIPNTCCELTCPICAVYGGLRLESKNKATLIGRLTHGGGVAIQSLDPQEKQRAMHPAEIARQDDTSPTPYRREYNEPGLFYPISNHLLSVTEAEFFAAAYAFLDSLARIGAGNPKGVRLAEHQKQPLLVVDQYTSPMAKRPVLSPHTQKAEEAIEEFLRLAHGVHGASERQDQYSLERFQRKIGDPALEYLQSCADQFVAKKLQG